MGLHPIPGCQYERDDKCMSWWDPNVPEVYNKPTTLEGYSVKDGQRAAYGRVLDNFNSLKVGKSLKHMAPPKDQCESLGWYVTCQRHNYAGKWYDGGYTRVDSTDPDVVHKDPMNDYDGVWRKRGKDELLKTFKSKYCVHESLHPCEFRFLKEKSNADFDTPA